MQFGNGRIRGSGALDEGENKLKITNLKQTTVNVNFIFVKY